MDFRGIREFFKDTIGYIVVIVVVILIANYVVTLQQNVGPSMQPTLKSGDLIILNKAAYRLTKVKRNDVIAFLNADTKYLVKRVIGLPGERIDYIDNVLYINNKAYEEDFLSSKVKTSNFKMEDITGCEKGFIPRDTYLVLGDNRINSMDSRKIGVIKESNIIGKSTFRIWPFTKIGFIK
jgi:signal peptidase I